MMDRINGRPSVSYSGVAGCVASGGLLEYHLNWSCLNMPMSNARELMMRESSWLCPVVDNMATTAFCTKKPWALGAHMGVWGYHNRLESFHMMPCLSIWSTYMDLGDWL